ncbi:MAG TPA: MFS transporter [Dehalococcoidia bacterium]|nr:MFS transporter [Dehalococcoidia bacterium]
MKINDLIRRISNLKTFTSFKIPAYRMYFFGMVGQWSTFSMEQVARSYLLYEITGSAVMLGVINLSGTIPILVLSLFGGAVADRFPKKTLIQLSQVGMTVVFLGYGIAVSIGYLTKDHPESWWVLMTGGLLMGIIIALAMPSRAAIIPEIVDRERLMNAISLNTMGMSFFQLGGPAIAGYIIEGFGYSSVFFIMSGLNALAIIFTSFLPKTTSTLVNRKSVIKDIGEGFRYIKSHQTVRLILAFFIAAILLAMPFQMLMPVFAKDILKVGVGGQGTLMSMSGVGAIVASLIIASLPSRRRAITLLISNMIMGGALVVFAFSTSWPLSLMMMVVVGIGRIGGNTTGNALLQTHTEPEYLGRVMSIMMLNFGLSGLGTFFAGILAETISAPWAIGGLAMILISISLFAIIFLPGFRKLD